MKEKYDACTKEFMESWKQLDWRKTLEILGNNVKYYEIQLMNHMIIAKK